MKEETSILIRDARLSDAPFITECVLAGIGMWSFDGAPTQEQMHVYDGIAPECSMEESLYSYRNMRILEVDGEVAGGLISYPGDDYRSLRLATWDRIDRRMGGDDTGRSDDETGPGEYYLDTLVLRPEFRKKGLGPLLISDAVAKARQKGIERIVLIVECDHPALITYYEHIGFTIESRMVFLGEPYYKCVYHQ